MKAHSLIVLLFTFFYRGKGGKARRRWQMEGWVQLEQRHLEFFMYTDGVGIMHRQSCFDCERLYKLRHNSLPFLSNVTVLYLGGGWMAQLVAPLPLSPETRVRVPIRPSRNFSGV